MEYTPEQIEKKFESLPEDVKDAISSVETTNIILEIGKENKLQIDEMGELVDETGLVMLGFTKSEDFVSHIKNRLNVSNEIAEKLAREINEKVLLQIRESLKKMHEKPKEEEFSPKTTPISPIEEVGEDIIKPPLKDQLIKEEIKTQQLSDEDIFDEKEERDKIMKELESSEKPLELKEQETGLIKKPTTSLTQPKEIDIIESKLKGMVRMPIEKKEIKEEVKTEPQQVQKKVMDPYREPIE